MLKVNPFPRVAIPHKIEIYYDPDNNLRKILTYVVSSIRNNSIATVTIIGAYGYGKTHTLKYIKRNLESKGVKAFYVQSPGRGFIDLYRVVIEEALKESILTNNPGYIDPQFKEVFLNLSNEELANYAKMWLLGEKLPINIRYKLGVGSNINEYKALNYLVNVIKLFLHRYEGAAVIIDELEAILTLPRRSRLTYLELLRNFIDSLPPRSSIIVALTPACWDELNSLNVALARRLSSMIIYLRSLKRSEVKDFLNIYLKSMYKSLDITDLIDEDALQYLHDVVNGNPGELLKLASIIIDEIINGNRNGKLHLDEVKDIIANYV